jgi:hypothetical protein
MVAAPATKRIEKIDGALHAVGIKNYSHSAILRGKSGFEKASPEPVSKMRRQAAL